LTNPARDVVLAGGFGGARMAHGFALLGEQVELTVIGNTADDLELHGLYVSPDLDTVMYTLAGLANPDTGWGVRDETWSAAKMLARYGAPTWFRLGDRDLATHIVRTQRLRAGERLTDVTARLTRGLAISTRLLPMSDDPVRTKVRTDEGWLDFQDYFVRRGQADDVLEIRFAGIDRARPTPQVLDALAAAELIVVAPSNPFVSVGPILAVPGMLDALQRATARTLAVSPIVGGAAVRGPAAAMLRTLESREPTAAAIAAHYAQHYPGLLDVLVIDSVDGAQAAQIAATGIAPLVTDTLIGDEPNRRRLAGELLA
jgi:LPPG:FO 2-phospho-L-lactate transferase